MNTNFLKSLRFPTLLLCCLLLTVARARDVESPVPANDDASESVAPGTTTTFESDASKDDEADSHGTAADHDDDDDWSTPSDSDSAPPGKHHRHHYNIHRGNSHGSDNDVVSIGRKAELSAGEHADAVIAIFGSATSAGEVNDAVVSVLGSTHVTGGKVGDAAVAVLGSAYVNGEVEGDVVAVLGNVELGPEAKVHGDIVVVGGELTRDPKATVDGHVQNVFGVEWADFDWLHPWVERCLLYGRPLAFSPGLGWAWGIALGLLALYLFVAFVFRSAVDKCVHTLDTQPGHSILAALLLTLGVPVLFVLLFITVLGIAAVPFLAIAIICAAVFGKVVVLAAIGRRCTPMLTDDPTVHTVVGVLVGGLIVMVIYTIPVVGFIVYKLLELLGLGVVVYTLLLSVRAGRQARAAGGGGVGPGAGPSGAAGPGATSGVDPGASVGAGPSASSGPGPNPYTTSPPPRQAAPNMTALPRAGFGIRMGALLLDVVLIGILLHQLHERVNVELLALAAYGAVMWKLKASTIGGIICGLQVVRLDGRPIDWPTAIVRALSCFLSLAVVGLGFIWIAIDNDKQSWHDKIAGTVVVRAPKGASLL